MSVAQCVDFLRAVNASPETRQVLKAMTAPAEIMMLGRARGFDFDAEELAAASRAWRPPAGAQATPAAAPAEPRTVFYHHEFDIAATPEFAEVAAELPNLAIQPATVDLTRFHQAFRADDMRLLGLAPNSDPAFAELAAASTERPGTPDEVRRDFHLINLDEHVEHAGYVSYFAAKTRVIRALERLFDAEIRFSGSMWYPPRSYRMWHTNESQPGWRMYVVVPQASAREAAPEQLPYFRYQHPATGELVTLPERAPLVRFFKAEQDPRKLFWHCIANPGPHHRWSFGFVVPDSWRQRLPVHAATGGADGA